MLLSYHAARRPSIEAACAWCLHSTPISLRPIFPWLAQEDRTLTPPLRSANLPSAILVAAHGDAIGDDRNAAVRRLAADLGRRLGMPADWAVLKEPTTFAAAGQRLGAAAEGRVLVAPFFLSDGYFARVKLPKLLADNGFATTERLTVFGALPGLADLVAARIATLGGATPARKVLLVAHGSASGLSEPRQAAEAIAEQLAGRGLGAMHLAYIEEPPSVADQLEAISPEIVIGLFASEGIHALEDLAALLKTAPSVRGCIPAIGTDPGVADLFAAAARAHLRQPTPVP